MPVLSIPFFFSYFWPER